MSAVAGGCGRCWGVGSFEGGSQPRANCTALSWRRYSDNQLPRSSAVGRQPRPAAQPSQRPACPSAVPSARDAMPAGGRSPARLLCSPPSLAGSLGHPQTKPARDGVPAAWGGGDRGVLVAPCPRLLADRWRWRISVGDRAGSPGDLGFPGSTPRDPSALSSTRLKQRGHPPGKRPWMSSPRQGQAAGCPWEGLWPSAMLCSGGDEDAVPFCGGVARVPRTSAVLGHAGRREGTAKIRKSPHPA